MPPGSQTLTAAQAAKHVLSPPHLLLLDGSLRRSGQRDKLAARFLIWR